MGIINRKVCSLLLFLTLLLLMIPTAAFAANSNLPVTVDLKAGGTTVGHVSVTLSGSNVNVAYSIDSGKAWSSATKSGMIFKSIDFGYFDGNLPRGYTQSFQTSDHKTSYDFSLKIGDLRGFTANANLADIQPNVAKHTLTLVSGVDDNAVRVDSIPVEWGTGSQGKGDPATKTLIGSLQNAGAKWIWKSAKVSYYGAIHGEIFAYARSFTIPADAAITGATLEVECDNAYIAQINGKYAKADDFNAVKYLSKIGQSSQGSDAANMNYCFSHLHVSYTGPYDKTVYCLKDDVVPSGGWRVAPATVAQDVKTLLHTGSNSLGMKGINEYMNTDDTSYFDNPQGDKQGVGNANSNPAGVLYRLTVDYTTTTYVEGKPFAATCKWTEPAPVYYTVNFVTYGGTPVPADQIVKAGDTANRPSPNPTRNSDSFSGWYTEPYPNYGQEFDFDTRIYHDTTVYARWTSNDPGGESFPIFGALPSFFEMFN